MAQNNATDLTLEGVGSAERRALEQAVNQADTEFPIRNTIDVTQVTESNIDELLSAISDVEIEMRECEAYSEAEGANRLYRTIQQAAREMGLKP